MLNVKVYDNGDHTCIVWIPKDEKPISGCLGFVIRREIGGHVDYSHGAVGFSAVDQFDPAAPWKFPVQRFMWWDYFVHPGDQVSYQVVPVNGSAASPTLDEANASDKIQLTISGQCEPHVSAFFNKGIVAAQWVSRQLDQLKAGLSADEAKKIKIKDVVADPSQPLRQKLSGLLRLEILKRLKDAFAGGGEIYAALYELNDPELIPALKAFEKKCHLILANGAFSTEEPDENKEVREKLRPTVDLYDRLVTSGHFGHNKFVVFCDKDGKPTSVLTGSTNWTTPGYARRPITVCLSMTRMSRKTISRLGIASRTPAIRTRPP